MSVHESTQSGSGGVQLVERAAHAKDRPRDLRSVADISGLTLSDAELMVLLGLKRSSFGLRKKAGLYNRFVCRPKLGLRTQYSGALIQKWRDGFGKDDRLPVAKGQAGDSQGHGLRVVKGAR